MKFLSFFSLPPVCFTLESAGGSLAAAIVGIFAGIVVSCVVMRYRRSRFSDCAAEAGVMYRSLLDSLPGYVFVKETGHDFRYVLVNRNRNLFVCDSFGDVTGKTDADLFPPDMAMHLRQQDEEILRTGRGYFGVSTYVDPEGRPVQLKVFKQLHLCADGTRLIVGIGIDVSHEYELEWNLEAKIRELNRHIRDERRMNRCLSLISGSGGLDSIVNSMLEELAGESKADRLAVFRLDGESGAFRVSHEWHRISEEAAEPPPACLEAGPGGALRELLETEETICLPDTQSPPPGLEVPAEAFRTSGVRSLLLSGIRCENGLAGLVSMEFRDAVPSFSEEDKRAVGNAASLFRLASERERRLRALEESMAVQRQMIDNMPMPVLLFSPDYIILSVNSEICQTFGRNKEELIGHKCYNTLCNCDESPEWCPMRKTLEDGCASQTGNRIRERDYIIHSQPIFDGDGKLLYVLETWLDVTEQFRQAHRLSMQNLLLSNAAAVAKITYFSGNSSGVFRVVGGSTAIGLPVDGFRTFLFADWLIPEDRAPFEELCRRIVSGADDLREMVCRSVASGEMRSYRLVLAPDRNRQEAFVGILLDVTSNVAFEAERQELIKSLNNHVENERIVNAGLSQIVLEEDFDRNVEAILRIIATQLGSDRAYFGVFEEEGCTFRVCHEWLNVGVTSLKSIRDPRFYAQMLKWYGRFRNNELLTIPDVRSSEYADVLEESGYRTLMCAPVWAGRNFRGILGLGFLRECRGVSELDRTIMRSAARLIEISYEHQVQRDSLDALDRQNRMIIGSIQVPICLFDDKGQLIRCNPAALQLTGASEEQMAARSCRWNLCEHSELRSVCPVCNALKNGEPYTHDLVINGHECRVTASPIRDRNGKVVHVIKSVIDMSEINESRRQLEIAVEAARAADKAKSAFLATMSHELRTPLNAVIGFSELLKAENLPQEERSEYIQSINLAGNALLNLINDVLDISKIEAEQMVIVPQPTELRSLIGEITAVFRYRMLEKDLYFHLECPDDLPVLMLDSQRFRQILFNLIGNAVKFTPSGGITLTVEFLRIDEEHGTLRVKVADTGVGIRPEAQERIFLPFVQQDAARDSRLFNGTGLGLAISRRLATGMGGTLRVESVPGAGSCFILEFPAACTDQKPQKAEEPDWEGGALSGRILLVDDVPMNQRVLQTMAEKLGCTCCIAGSGAEALRILDREKNFDLVLTDLWMPEMNGTELAGKVAEKTGGATPVIAVTADTQIATGLSSVFDGVLLKPITPRMLGNAIRKAKRKRKTDEPN